MNRIRTAGTTLRRHPRWSSLGLVVVLAVIGGGIFLGVSGSSSATTTTGTTTVETVTTGTIKQSVAATGTLAPAVDDTLTFGSSGTVTSVLVTEGQTVAAGQALATIDSSALAATVAQNAATVANDQVKVADDTDATSAQLAADQAALTAAQTALTSAQAALAGATLTAPVAGVVASVGYTTGESTSGSGSSGGAGGGATAGGSGTGSATSTTTTTAGIRVISTDSWLVNATVDATSVDLIKTGDQAELTISGATDAVYGTISSIAVLSSSTGTTAAYPVVVAVTGTPTGLHDGESVTAALVYKQLTNVLEVSTAAVHRASDGTAYVDKVTNGATTRTTVQTGVSAGGSTQITSGLADGDQVQVTQIRPGAGTTGGTTTRGGTGGEGGTGGGFGGPPGGFGGAGGAGTGGGLGG